MSAQTYIVQASRFGHLINRAAVEKGALEGRNIVPVVEYLEKGAKVELDPSNDVIKKAALSGAIVTEDQAKTLAEIEAKRRELEAEAAALRAEAAQVGSEDPAADGEFDVESARKKQLEAKADELGLTVEGTGSDGAVTVDDLRDAIRAHQGQ